MASRWLARTVTGAMGGRCTTELGIDVDKSDGQIERWFLAATLFSIRITARIAERTFRVLEQAGVVRIDQARHIPMERLVALLDRGGYARYDYVMTDRLQELSEVVKMRYYGQVAVIGRMHTSYPELSAALDALPGWGPVTVELFLRELRGVWPGAQPPLNSRAAHAARHLSLLNPLLPHPGLASLAALAAASGLNVGDLEAALVRLDLAHRRRPNCAGGASCRLLPVASGPSSLFSQGRVT